MSIVKKSYVFKEFPKRKLNRLKTFNYSSGNGYFVTLCSDNRAHVFGQIEGGLLLKSPCGKIAETTLVGLSEYFQNLVIDEYVIMPNHVHIIFIVDEKSGYNLSSIIQSYKSACVREGKEKGYIIKWQRSFFDHIIRDEKSLVNIKEYIRNNPLKWELDVENKSGIDIKRYYEDIISGKIMKEK